MEQDMEMDTTVCRQTGNGLADAEISFTRISVRCGSRRRESNLEDGR
jgi:hypothetical protein